MENSPIQSEKSDFFIKKKKERGKLPNEILDEGSVFLQSSNSIAKMANYRIKSFQIRLWKLQKPENPENLNENSEIDP